jgi:hypothetical protein
MPTTVMSLCNRALSLIGGKRLVLSATNAALLETLGAAEGAGGAEGGDGRINVTTALDVNLSDLSAEFSGLTGPDGKGDFAFRMNARGRGAYGDDANVLTELGINFMDFPDLSTVFSDGDGDSALDMDARGKGVYRTESGMDVRNMSMRFSNVSGPDRNGDFTADMEIRWTMEIESVYAALAAAGAQQEAVACALSFESARDSLLEMYPWVFAAKEAALAELSAPTGGWGHSYALPADCLRVLELTQSGRSRRVFEITGGTVSCPRGNVSARYTRRARDVASWPPCFQDAFCARLASEIAVAVTGNVVMAQRAGAIAEVAIREGYRLRIIDETPARGSDLYRWDRYFNDDWGEWDS